MADDQFEQLAVASYKRAGGQIIDDFLPRLNGQSGRRILRQMAENDETIGGVLLAMNSVYRTVPWFVDPSDKEDPEAVEYAEWLNDTLFKYMGDPRGALPDDTWDAFVQTWTDNDVFGFMWYDNWIKDLEDGSIGIARLVPVSPETVVGWEIEEPYGYVLGVKQQGPSTGLAKIIPRDRSLHLIAGVNKGSPEGRSILRTAYRLWFYKKMHLEIESILAERGTGFPVITVNSDLKKMADDPGVPEWQRKSASAAINSYEALVKGIKRNEQSGAVIYSKPYQNVDADGNLTYSSEQQVKLELVTPSASNPVDIDRTIKRLDVGIARALLADFLFFGTNGNTGNQSNLGDRTQLWVKAMQSRVESIVSCINRQLVDQLWKLNAFPQELKPILRAGSITKESADMLVSSLQKLAQAGAVVFPDEKLQEHVYTELGLPIEGIESAGNGLPGIED